MFDEAELTPIREARASYERELAAQEKGWGQRQQTLSGIQIQSLYTPLEIAGMDYLEQVGFPGRYPFTRGAFPLGYKARPWTVRPLVSLGTAEETNARMKYLLKQGATGFAIPGVSESLVWDSDAEVHIGYLGRNYVALDSLADFETLFEGIDLEQVSLHLNTWHARGVAMYFALAQQRGLDLRRLRGSNSNGYNRDCIDIIEYCTRHVPLWNAGYVDVRNTREAGCTAVQEVAFAIARGIDLVRDVLARGLAVDDFAPRISFFVSVQTDFFEEVAKLRAMRRMWARTMKQIFGARDPRSWRMRCHVQTSGVSLTRQQPLNNLARCALQGLAAVLGGAQSLHICAFDEAFATPTTASALLSQRTQQILLYETGVTHVVDPLGGSYYVEWLTNQLEAEAQKLVESIEAKGGAKAAESWMAEQVRQAAYEYQRQVETGERVVVGGNRFVMDDEEDPYRFVVPAMEYDPGIREKQIARLQRLRRERDQTQVEEAKRRLYHAWRQGENIMPVMIEAVKSYITGGEIGEVRRQALGEDIYWPWPAWIDGNRS